MSNRFVSGKFSDGYTEENDFKHFLATIFCSALTTDGVPCGTGELLHRVVAILRQSKFDVKVLMAVSQDADGSLDCCCGWYVLPSESCSPVGLHCGYDTDANPTPRNKVVKAMKAIGIDRYYTVAVGLRNDKIRVQCRSI